MSAEAKVGDRLSYGGALCTVRFVGEVDGTTGSWIGVEWDDGSRGKHDGSHKGKRYFQCISSSPTAASFVRPTRATETPCSFIAAVKAKYTSEISSASAQIRFSSKVAEEVGFEKIRRKQADLAELKFAILDGARIDDRVYDAGDERIMELCSKVVEIDLSRNLFTKAGTVVRVCEELPGLRNLRLNGNRFQDVLRDEGLEDAEKHLQNVKDLALEETLLSWKEISHIATRCPALTSLSADANQLSSLPSTSLLTLTTTLQSLNLEFNNFTSLADLSSLSELKALRNLHLKGNNIASIAGDDTDTNLPIFSSSIQYLDVSYNRVSSWSFIDDLPQSLPGFTSLRFAHNPIYDNPDLPSSSSSAPTSQPPTSKSANMIAEEAYMITLSRLPSLTTLNFGTITPASRQDAEMFYLARIGREMALVDERDEAQVTARHKRYGDLCELYGEPVVKRGKEVNPNFLEARLVTVHFAFKAEGHEGGVVDARTTRIPKSFDVYRVKGVAGALFGRKPLELRLVWETGEWDPVFGFEDEEDDEDSDAEEEEARAVAEVAGRDGERKGGKWVKREVELADGPRQLGFVVDGDEVRVRVELRP